MSSFAFLWPAVASVITGAALYVTRGVLDQATTAHGVVRFAMLPPWQALLGFIFLSVEGLSFGDVRRFVDAIVGGVVSSLWAILGLGFVVGSLGVANTVTMNVLEKKRTFGLLRAVGMTRGQVTRMVVLESVLLGAAGGIIGLAAGMVSALFIQLSSQPLLGHPVSVTFRPAVVATNLAAAVAVTALAAWLPARRAVRMDLLEAISAE